MNISAKAVRNIRKLERPRPLKLVPDLSRGSIPSPNGLLVQKKSKADIMQDLETLHISISNTNFDEITAADISRMCAILKNSGGDLDTTHKSELDRFFVTLRNASRDERLDMISRIKLLEIIELRAHGWELNENCLLYFKKKIEELELGVERMQISDSTSPSITNLPLHNQFMPVTSAVPLAPGEILRSSGKFSKPTKITGKNYFKDEIIIRNSDSGKVMGIKGRRVHMIEELSDTVISFQRVNPGARDRLVQITGPHEEAISHAKLLVEDTIRRNASPVKENMDPPDFINNDTPDYNSYPPVDNPRKQLSHSYSTSDATTGDYSIPINIGQDTLQLVGSKIDLLKTAKSVLEAYFAGQAELQDKSLGQMQSFHATSGENFRFDLKKSFLNNDNMPNPFQSSWMSQNKSESLSLSSSEEEINKELKGNAIERNKVVHDLPSRASAFNALNNLRTQEVAATALNVHVKPARSFSVPNDSSVFFNQESQKEISPFSQELSLSPVINFTGVECPPIPPPSYKKRTYTREFLLLCAKSPHSHKQPADYVEIHKNYQEIINKSPVMFDPTRYLERKSEDRN